MLEILVLVGLCSLMGSRLRARGINPRLMQWLVVLVWFASMIVAAFVTVVIVAIASGSDGVENLGWKIYPAMLLAAVMGEVVVFSIAESLGRRPIRSAADGEGGDPPPIPHLQVSASTTSTPSASPRCCPGPEHPTTASTVSPGTERAQDPAPK